LGPVHNGRRPGSRTSDSGYQRFVWLTKQQQNVKELNRTYRSNDTPLNRLASGDTAPLPPVAPAIFLGYQKSGDQGLEQPLELWTLTADIPGHPVSSTVSRLTLEKAGYVVPLPLEELPAPAWAP